MLSVKALYVVFSDTVLKYNKGVLAQSRSMVTVIVIILYSLKEINKKYAIRS